MNKARPCNQGTDAIQTKAPNEDCFVAVVAEDPIGMAQ